MKPRVLLSDPRFVATLRVLLGVLFLAAALPKIADPEGFAKAVDHYHLLPVPAARAVALVLPPVEAIVGVCLIAGFVDAGASLLVFALMVVFTGAVGSALARGLDISCGCFDTKGGTRVGARKIVENLLLCAAAWTVLRGDRSRFSLRGRRGR
ncbi:MAG: MauE/DoxX family redox-associated membrane protein [Gemmatimonadota bacterium]|nr:MauE/DoxX family redox-associated membrane protein [Gemmatimonadota bacterium]MDP6803529.1 MauE/DoxX family redox-associated membrane protein [Gemmatimonadota bacterium]MDP7032530.1 MauE/DoxX family redox-associated membrane protein [Gemmatimonadota bacterium]